MSTWMFPLWIELPNDKYCNGCPCHDKVTELCQANPNIKGKITEMAGVGQPDLVFRPKACPLKPKNTCRECDSYNVDNYWCRTHQTYCVPAHNICKKFKRASSTE